MTFTSTFVKGSTFNQGHFFVEVAETERNAERPRSLPLPLQIQRSR